MTCETANHDKYGRHLARCVAAGADVAEWLASQGWVVPYRDCKCETVRAAAETAKSARLNIWSGTFELPWEWRKAN